MLSISCSVYLCVYSVVLCVIKFLRKGSQSFIPSLLFCLLLIGVTSCGKNGTDNNVPEDTPSMTVSERRFSIGSEGGTLYATLSSNRTVTVTPDKPWCTAMIFEGVSANNLIINVNENGGEERAAGILLSAEDCPNIYLIVTQAEHEHESDFDDDKKYLQFRVATYNVRAHSTADVPGGNGWSNRKEPVTDIIKTHDFDVVGTQEPNDSQVADMQALLPDYSYVTHVYGSGNGHNCATYYKKDMFEVPEHGVFWYSPTPDVPSIGWDATDRRICSWIRFREKSTGIEFYYFNSHFWYTGTTAKQNSGTILVQKVKDIAGDAPVICVGDYNSTPTTSQILHIKTLLRDAYDITITPRQGPTNTAFVGGVFHGTPVWRLDYIFVNSHFYVLDYAVLTDSNHEDGRYPSDHLPVTSMLAIKID